MAQWIARWTSNPEVAGSNPVEDDLILFIQKIGNKNEEIRIERVTQFRNKLRDTMLTKFSMNIRLGNCSDIIEEIMSYLIVVNKICKFCIIFHLQRWRSACVVEKFENYYDATRVE